MMDNLPDDTDKSELQIPWDYTRPAAIEKAEFAEFELNEAIKLIFPQWSWGEWLDLHAEKARIVRRPANPASGTLTVTGTAGTVISKGYQFATPANLTASVIFEATEETVLDGTPTANGQVTVDISIKAAEGGNQGNVPTDAIKLMVKPTTGISYLTNPEAMTGGTPPEDDDSLIDRVLSALRLGTSYVGNNADYIRWAKEVPGVGDAICIPEAFGPGTVELIVVDSNGIPANQQILDAVYSHIMGAGASDIERLAPIGATLTTAAPSSVSVDISATVALKAGEEIATVTARFKSGLAAYWHSVAQETQESEIFTGYVRWVKVGAALADTQGVADYADLLVNGGTENIPVTQEQYPVTGTVTLAEVTASG
jgi:uncharacterized phage protein gp47/JayE